MEPPLLRRDLEFAAQDKAYQSLLTANMNPGVQPLTYIQYQGLEVKRQMFKEKWAEFFEDWDVLLCPVMPTSAFPHDHDMSRKSHDYCSNIGLQSSQSASNDRANRWRHQPAAHRQRRRDAVLRSRVSRAIVAGIWAAFF